MWQNQAMHDRLCAYLRDNRDQILEHWLTEAELPLPEETNQTAVMGAVPLAFLEGAFDRVLATIAGKPCRCNGHDWRKLHHAEGAMHLDDFLNVTCACRIQKFGGRVCLELQKAGFLAFTSVFNREWDAGAEFNDDERVRSAELINEALAATFGQEVLICKHRLERPDCPFSVANN